jgi:hexosaminidase
MEDARTRSKTFVDNAIARAFGRGRGEFQIDGSFGIAFTGYIEPRLERARQRFLDTLSRETGIPLWRDAAVNQVHFTIHTSGPSLPIQQLGEDESYHLMISATSVQLSAANPLGVTHGRQTFLQLVRLTPRGFTVPALSIDDTGPRYAQ